MLSCAFKTVTLLFDIARFLALAIYAWCVRTSDNLIYSFIMVDYHIIAENLVK